MIGGYPQSQLDTSDRQWPSSVAAAEAIRRRCLSCHDKSWPVPQYLSDDLGLVLSNPDPQDVRMRWSRHLMFNLSHPERSLILLAPLAQEAGGYGLCRPTGHGALSDSAPSGAAMRPRPAPIFANTQDADYQKILTLCREGQTYLDRIKRFDMPGFRPPAMYVREMQRFGILSQDLSYDRGIDVYATDQAYWQSLWWQPTLPGPPSKFRAGSATISLRTN
jgi:hypothetical protein